MTGRYETGGPDPEGQYSHKPACTHARHVIWLGDFNLHHPLWDKDQNVHLFTWTNLDKVQFLLNAIADLDLQMTLPKDIPMLHTMASGNYMRPDNILASNAIFPLIFWCIMIPEE